MPRVLRTAMSLRKQGRKRKNKGGHSRRKDPRKLVSIFRDAPPGEVIVQPPFEGGGLVLPTLPAKSISSSPQSDPQLNVMNEMVARLTRDLVSHIAQAEGKAAIERASVDAARREAGEEFYHTLAYAGAKLGSSLTMAAASTIGRAQEQITFMGPNYAQSARKMWDNAQTYWRREVERVKPKWLGGVR